GPGAERRDLRLHLRAQPVLPARAGTLAATDRARVRADDRNRARYQPRSGPACPDVRDPSGDRRVRRARGALVRWAAGDRALHVLRLDRGPADRDRRQRRGDRAADDERDARQRRPLLLWRRLGHAEYRTSDRQLDRCRAVRVVDRHGGLELHRRPARNARHFRGSIARYGTAGGAAAAPRRCSRIARLPRMGGRRGMKHMLDYLVARPDKGLLAYEMGLPTIVQYWRSFEHLEAFAKDK